MAATLSPDQNRSRGVISPLNAGPINGVYVLIIQSVINPSTDLIDVLIIYTTGY